jgi:hypothetical protein
MTDKQFVQSVFQTAYAKKFYLHGWMIVGGFDYNKWDTTAKSASCSWKLAAQIVREKMIKILEA